MDTSMLSQYGLAGLCISVLAGTVLYLYKELKSERGRTDEIQNARLQDAKETRDKISESMEQTAFLSRQIYELLQQLFSESKRRR